MDIRGGHQSADHTNGFQRLVVPSRVMKNMHPAAGGAGDALYERDGRHLKFILALCLI